MGRMCECSRVGKESLDVDTGIKYSQNIKRHYQKRMSWECDPPDRLRIQCIIKAISSQIERSVCIAFNTFLSKRAESDPKYGSAVHLIGVPLTS